MGQQWIMNLLETGRLELDIRKYFLRVMSCYSRSPDGLVESLGKHGRGMILYDTDLGRRMNCGPLGVPVHPAVASI